MPVACLNVVHGFGLFCRTEKYNFGQIDVDRMVIDYIPVRIKQAGFQRIESRIPNVPSRTSRRPSGYCLMKYVFTAIFSVKHVLRREQRLSFGS